MQPNNEYAIKTIQDLVNIATDKNVDYLLTDLKNFLMVMNSDVGNYCDKSTFTWIDDGENNVTLGLTQNDWSKDEFESVADAVKNYSAYSEEFIDETRHNISVLSEVVTKGKLVYEFPK